MNSIATGVADCRFEATDRSSYEVTLRIIISNWPLNCACTMPSDHCSVEFSRVFNTITGNVNENPSNSTRVPPVSRRFPIERRACIAYGATWIRIFKARELVGVAP